MKRTLFLLLLFPMLAFSQFKEQFVKYGTATTSWTVVARDSTFLLPMLDVEVIYDDTGTDTLWVAWGTDTTSTKNTAGTGRRFPMVVGDASYMIRSTYIRRLYLKTSANTIPYRVVFH